MQRNVSDDSWCVCGVWFDNGFCVICCLVCSFTGFLTGSSTRISSSCWRPTRTRIRSTWSWNCKYYTTYCTWYRSWYLTDGDFKIFEFAAHAGWRVANCSTGSSRKGRTRRRTRPIWCAKCSRRSITCTSRASSIATLRSVTLTSISLDFKFKIQNQNFFFFF